MRSTTLLLAAAALTLAACESADAVDDANPVEWEADGRLAFTLSGVKIQVTPCLKDSKSDDCQDTWLSDSKEEPRFMPSETEGASNGHPNPNDAFLLQNEATGGFVEITYTSSGFLVSSGRSSAEIHTGKDNLPTWIAVDNLVISDGADLQFVTESGDAFILANLQPGAYYDFTTGVEFVSRDDVVPPDPIGRSFSF